MSKPVNKPRQPDPSVTAFEFMRRFTAREEAKAVESLPPKRKPPKKKPVK